MTASAVIVFVAEPIRISVSAAIGRLVATSAIPYWRSSRTRSSFTTTTTAPAILRRESCSGISRSTNGASSSATDEIREVAGGCPPVCPDKLDITDAHKATPTRNVRPRIRGEDDAASRDVRLAVAGDSLAGRLLPRIVSHGVTRLTAA